MSRRMNKASWSFGFATFAVVAALLADVASAKNYNDGRSNTAGRVYETDQFPANGHDFDAGALQVYKPPGRAINEKGVQITAYGGGSPVLQSDGTWHVDSFFDIFYSIELKDGDGPLTTFTGIGTGRVVGTAPPSSGPVRTFDTEMLSMDLSIAIDPNQNWHLRESPTWPTRGQATLTDLGDGQWRIDSFFDVFTELSIDGGASWHAGQAIPEPASMSLAALSLAAINARRRRREVRVL